MKRRINAFLALGLSISRRAADEIVRSGSVMVNDRPGVFWDRVDEEDDVRWEGRRIELPRLNVAVFNKPPGLITAVSDSRFRTILDILPKEMRTLKPVGRLDRDTRGLLFLTNAGDFSLRVQHPRYGVEKEYEVCLDSKPMKKRLRGAVMLADGVSRFKNVRMIGRREGSAYWISVTLSEGRKRQIRRALQKLGYNVLDLVRIRIGGVSLGDLPEGEWRMLKEDEIEKTFS